MIDADTALFGVIFFIGMAFGALLTAGLAWVVTLEMREPEGGDDAESR